MNQHEIIKKGYEFKVNSVYWNKDRLTGDECTFERNYPIPYILKTIELLQLCNINKVIEIGTIRLAVANHCINNNFNSPCCSDGHSTYFWAHHGFETHTVDIDPNCRTAIQWTYENLKQEYPINLHLHNQDGIEFLRNYQEEIPFLFLDGWDKGSTNYAENHLEAYMVCKDKLSPTHFILIDDTDYDTEEGGKDKLLTPYLIDQDYIILFKGRQTLFYKWKKE